MSDRIATEDYVDDAVAGGGGAVDSVNGETGVVVLDAADVGAEAAGAVATHAGAANPHPTYETSAEAQAKVDTHAATPHGTGLGAPVVRTVAAGVIDVTGLSYVIVNGEGAADDVLLAMTGGVDGQIVYLEQGNATVTVARGDGPPNGFVYLNQERTDNFQLGNFTLFIRATYSATQGGVWLVEGDYVPTSIMSGSGETEIIASDTYGLYFRAGTQRAFQITEDAVGVSGKIGFFAKADEATTVAQQTADTIDEMWDAFKAYGLLDTGSTSPGAGGSGAPDDATYLVTTAHAGLSAEIVVGATPGGELGNTWASPTVDATHSGSSHAGVVTAHEAAADPHTGYQLESGLAAAITATKIDDLTAGDDNTDLNSSTTKHGLLRKLSNTATEYLDGSGAWSTPAGGSGIAATIFDAKGDLIAATAADTAARLAVGTTEGMMLAVAAAATPGLRWDANPGRPGIRPGAGFYYSPPFVAGGLAALVQNTLYAMPFYLSLDDTTSSLSVAAGGVASATAQLGIYANDNGKPGALIVDAGNIAIATGGHKSIATATALTAGWYWLAAAVQGAAGNLFTGGNNGPSGNVAVYTPYAAASVAGYSQTGITGALPSPWGATFTEKLTCPIVWVAF